MKTLRTIFGAAALVLCSYGVLRAVDPMVRSATTFTNAGVQAGGFLYCADAAGSGTTYTCTLTPTLTAYTIGMKITFKPGTASSGASTLNIDALGAKSIKSTDGTSAMAVDDLLANGVYTLEYDGTNFRILNGPDGPWKGLAAVGYTNSWADFGGAFQVGQYKKDINQRVCFRGLLNATNNQLTIITMPSGYRMSSNSLFPSLSGNATSTRLNFNSDGTVNFGANPGGAFASLEDICYSTR